MVKHPPANAGDVVQSLDLKDPLEKEMAAGCVTVSPRAESRSRVGYASSALEFHWR